ncbi:MAG: hypothetical protein K2M76_04665 [Muribaculaceae bacterium]|nr:hypothetical protein [Muribaculaceae bacterium]
MAILFLNLLYRHNPHSYRLIELFVLICSATASATRSPSIAAETIPPAYPAPSPAGYNPGTQIWVSVTGFRVILTGDDVRV